MMLGQEFYSQDTHTIAKQLIGKVIVHRKEGEIYQGRITETEAYIGEIDKACHCYPDRKTKRTEVMYAHPGTLYVYMIYGMYYCMNVVTEKAGTGAAVLIRGIAPINRNEMALVRFGRPYSKLTAYQKKNMGNGPGKVCKALNITKAENGISLMDSELLISDDGYQAGEIMTGKRLNIDYAEEAREFPWRYYEKKAEEQ
jgi:DNA-3-methyladenine glycosylase